MCPLVLEIGGKEKTFSNEKQAFVLNTKCTFAIRNIVFLFRAKMFLLMSRDIVFFIVGKAYLFKDSISKLPLSRERQDEYFMLDQSNILLLFKSTTLFSPRQISSWLREHQQH